MIPDKDFAKMEFDPTVKKRITSVYPKLLEVVGNGTDQELKYILCMYDINSPLRAHYPELSKRKEYAALISGYNLDKDDMVPVFEFKVVNSDGEFEPNHKFLDMVMNYLKYQNNWVWTMIISNSEAFYEYNKRVMSPVEGNRDKDILQAINIKTQIMESQDAIYQRLQKYYKDLSGGDDVLEESIRVRKRITPESIATR